MKRFGRCSSVLSSFRNTMLRPQRNPPKPPSMLPAASVEMGSLPTLAALANEISVKPEGER
ncbi:hypothetical protein P775_10545 [Puniceibacterium antarcticum]|uniref:Uncharacterized protein n=1 Tax=Puniceibacterium antarcticum TaxID=1206336 RepID=A0A2G8RF80_9RHOB|nr:hypothetical protein P775_10545 [Puniceibacterium antarcticum]